MMYFHPSIYLLVHQNRLSMSSEDKTKEKKPNATISKCTTRLSIIRPKPGIMHSKNEVGYRMLIIINQY